MNDLSFFICTGLSLFVLIIFVIKLIIDKKRFTLSVRNLLFASVIIVFILILPQYLSKYPPLTSAVFSLLYSLKTLTYGQVWDVCRWVVPENRILYSLYYGLIYLDFILIPVFTMSLLISLFSNLPDRIRLFICQKRRKPVIVFSALNQEAVSFASSVSQPFKSQIIFCGYSAKDQKESNETKAARQLGGILTEKTSSQLMFGKRKKQVAYYEISQDKNKNVQNALKLIDAYKDRAPGSQQVEIHLFAGGHVVETIFDSMDKGCVQVKILDELKFACYALLYNYPLYIGLNSPVCRADSKTLSPAEGGKISLLIIGGGSTGVEMIKAAIWCGQMNTADLEINVIDKSPEIQTRFASMCPEITEENGYHIRFFSCDVRSGEFNDLLRKHCSNTTYAIICMADDDLNLETGVRIREHFLRVNPPLHKGGYCAGSFPFINVRVRDEQKSKLVDTLQFQRENYCLHHFGTVSEIYHVINLSNGALDTLSKMIHVTYSLGKDKSFLDLSEHAFEEKLDGYYSCSYFQRLSLATAIHFKYKLFELLGKSVELNDLSPSDIQALRTSVSEQIDALALLEHRRWNAYMRTEGYILSQKKDVASYLELSKGSHKFELGKMHPCLVDWNNLDAVYQELASLPNINMPNDFKDSDSVICSAIPDMLEQLYKEREAT